MAEPYTHKVEVGIKGSRVTWWWKFETREDAVQKARAIREVGFVENLRSGRQRFFMPHMISRLEVVPSRRRKAR